MKPGHGAFAKKAGDEVSRILQGIVLSMKDFVGQHNAHARASVDDRSTMVAEILRKVVGKMENIVSGQSVLGNGFTRR